MALVAGGGYAEYVTVHMGCAMPIPSGISMVDAAGQCAAAAFSERPRRDDLGIPETFLTAFQGLRLIGNIKEGDAVLIHAGAR